MVTIDEHRRAAQAVQAPYHKLQLIDSAVRWVNLEASDIVANHNPHQQPIMCDFEIVKHDETPARFFVTLLLQMENNRKVEGVLSFTISSVTEFEFRPGAVAAPLPEDEQTRWQLFSIAVDTAISMTRGHLATYLAPTLTVTTI